jgi:hypothetical protein
MPAWTFSVFLVFFAPPENLHDHRISTHSSFLPASGAAPIVPVSANRSNPLSTPPHVPPPSPACARRAGQKPGLSASLTREPDSSTMISSQSIVRK